MSMDDEWKQVYELRAKRDIPDHRKVCWSKEGFEELFELTLKFVDEVNDSVHDKDDKIKTILDVGCGPGIYCDALNKKKFQVTGVDYSQEMIKLARQKYPDINFVEGSGYALQFSDKSFDLVISIGALQCLSDHEKFLNELCRVAQKSVIISTLWRDDNGEDPKLIFERDLRNDSWPTREYHSSEIVPILEKKSFSCKVIRDNENNKSRIKDGFFIIALKKE